jgi:hypothetical protein
MCLPVCLLTYYFTLLHAYTHAYSYMHFRLQHLFIKLVTYLSIHLLIIHSLIVFYPSLSVTPLHLTLLPLLCFHSISLTTFFNSVFHHSLSLHLSLSLLPTPHSLQLQLLLTLSHPLTYFNFCTPSLTAPPSSYLLTPNFSLSFPLYSYQIIVMQHGVGLPDCVYRTCHIIL